MIKILEDRIAEVIAELRSHTYVDLQALADAETLARSLIRALWAADKPNE